MSTRFADISQAIEARLVTQWAAATPIGMDNVPLPEQTGSHIILTILDGASFQVAYGMIRHTGIIDVIVRTAQDIGTRTGRTLADSVADIFERWQSGTGLTCRTPYIKRTGAVDKWFQYNVTIPFYFNDI